MRWEWIVVAYTAYFALVAWSRGYSPALRWGTVAALISTAVLTILPPPLGPWQTLLGHCLPLALLIGGYRLSGLFFVAPMAAIEARLLAVDRRMFGAMGFTGGLGGRGPLLRGALELAYLFVYAMVPLGVVALIAAGASDRVATYWAVVIASCFTSYAMLPWLQTRPPRVIEDLASPSEARGERASLRRLNLAILRSTSNQVNTLPSGHVAAALAVALMVLSSAPGIGLAFLAMAIAIAVATVVGRYHYTVDTLAGAAVALACWLCLGM